MLTPGVFEVVYLNFSTPSLVLFLDLEFICFWSICAGSIAAGEGASYNGPRGMLSTFKFLSSFSHGINVLFKVYTM